MPSPNTQSSTVSHFGRDDLTKIHTYIDNLVRVVEYNIATEQDEQGYTLIMNFYQEQPHVLDPYLQSWIDHLLKIVLTEETSQKGVDMAYKYLYLLTKVRGQKYMVRLFPHAVADMEIVLRMLESSRSEMWHAKYILFLWLSILVLIPFNMKRLDGANEAGYSVKRILRIAMTKLEGADKCSEAASLVVGKLVTRPDLHTEYLTSTLDSLLNTCKQSNIGSRLGCLTSLARIYKLGRREYLSCNSANVLAQLTLLELGKEQNTLLRKVETKLAQRIGLSFLTPRIAKWRYKRGARVLADSLKKVYDKDVAHEEQKEEEEEEEEYDIPNEIEEVLETLFRALRDSETIVRWSAAKGVGRITARLPFSLATDIVSTLLECFSPLETSSSWHGGCLALAELGRHGYLLPEHLPDVVPVLVKALQYDEKRGHLVLGANVRDSACYLSWSFARTFDPVQIAPFVHELATALILTTLFDRNVGCRRAASAAFQENVGRQGTFPYGIEILTACDYYAVALQSNTYLKLSSTVASYAPYTIPILNFLAKNRVKHWCPTIRRDAGKALRNLCQVAPHYIANNTLPDLITSTETCDFNGRHGALLAISNICLGLYEQNQLSLITPELVDKINDVINLIESRGSFRGSGGDEMYGAVCYYIEKISMSHLVLSRDTITAWHDKINLCIANPEQSIGVQKMAVDALSAFAEQYYTDSNIPQWSHLVGYYTKLLDHEFTATRVGAAYALSVLPGSILKDHLEMLVNLLDKYTKVRSKSEISLVECRVSAIRAITNVVMVTDPTIQFRHQVYNTLLSCMEDYSTDSRGDIGSFVREEAMCSLLAINTLLLSRGQPIVNLTLTKDLKLRLVCALLQQSLEKIDRTRQVAHNALYHLVYSGLELQDLEVLQEAIPRDMKYTPGCMENSQTLFSSSMQLIRCPQYIDSLVKGIIVSIGGLTESLVKASSAAFIDYLNDHEEVCCLITDSLIAVMNMEQKNDRIIIPLFKTVEVLLSNVMFEEETGVKFTSKFVARMSKELSKCGKVSKLLSAVLPLSNCIQYTNSSPAISLIMLLLCHRYPRVRKGMADAFYTALMSYSEVVNGEIINILECTLWDSPRDMAVLREHRNRLCVLLGVSTPKLIVSGVVRPKPERVEQLDSYSDLVGRAGY